MASYTAIPQWTGSRAAGVTARAGTIPEWSGRGQMPAVTASPIPDWTGQLNAASPAAAGIIPDWTGRPTSAARLVLLGLGRRTGQVAAEGDQAALGTAA